MTLTIVLAILFAIYLFLMWRLVKYLMKDGQNSNESDDYI